MIVAGVVAPPTIDELTHELQQELIDVLEEQGDDEDIDLLED